MRAALAEHYWGNTTADQAADHQVNNYWDNPVNFGELCAASERHKKKSLPFLIGTSSLPNTNYEHYENINKLFLIMNPFWCYPKSNYHLIRNTILPLIDYHFLLLTLVQ